MLLKSQNLQWVLKYLENKDIGAMYRVNVHCIKEIKKSKVKNDSELLKSLPAAGGGGGGNRTLVQAGSQ